MFSFIALGLSGALLSNFSQSTVTLFYAQLSVAVSVISLVVLIPTWVVR